MLAFTARRHRLRSSVARPVRTRVSSLRGVARPLGAVERPLRQGESSRGSVGRPRGTAESCLWSGEDGLRCGERPSASAESLREKADRRPARIATSGGRVGALRAVSVGDVGSSPRCHGHDFSAGKMRGSQCTPALIQGRAGKEVINMARDETRVLGLGVLRNDAEALAAIQNIQNMEGTSPASRNSNWRSSRRPRRNCGRPMRCLPKPKLPGNRPAMREWRPNGRSTTPSSGPGARSWPCSAMTVMKPRRSSWSRSPSGAHRRARPRPPRRGQSSRFPSERTTPAGLDCPAGPSSPGAALFPVRGVTTCPAPSEAT